MSDQTTTERFIADTSDYVKRIEEAARKADKFGNSNTDAALAARRMGVTAADAADKAGRAMRDAADAAARLGREEIGADEAARAAARGARELERADIAQAAAAKAAARATNELADQQRKAAEQAVVAAGMERLASLRTQGDLRNHNLLLTHLRRNYNGVGNDVSEMSTLSRRAFRTMAEAGTSAVGALSKGLASLGEMGPVAVGGIAVAIAALPAIAIAAGGAITLGLGGALAGLGIMAAAKTQPVKDAFSSMKAHISAEASTLGKPFVPVLEHIAFLGQKTFDSFMPALKGAEAEMAPAVSHFADGFAKGMQRFGPTITKVAAEFAPLLSALGDQMPTIMDNIATGIEKTVQAVSGHEADFAQFAVNLSKIVTAAGEVVSALAPLSSTINNFTPDSWGSFFSDLNPSTALANGLWKSLTGTLGGAKKGLDETSQASRGAQGGVTAAADAAGVLGTKVTTAYTAMQLASMSAADLKTKLDSLTGKELSARDAAANYADTIFAMNKSLHDNGSAHGYATEKGNANEKALTAMAKAANANAEAMKTDGQGANVVAKAMEAARLRIVAAAEKMGYSRSEAEKLATKLLAVRDAANKIPPAKNLKVTVDTAAALAAIARMRQQAGQPLPAAHFAASGGYIGHAAGGPVRHYAMAGPVIGPGTGTSDDIDAKLSNGEYVVRAASTARNRAALDAANYQGAQLVAVSKSASSSRFTRASAPADPFVKSSNDPWVRSSSDGWGRDNAGGAHTWTWMPPHHGLQSYGSSYGQQQVVNHNYYVAGSVTTENDLLNMVQTKALQQGKTFSLPAGR